MKTNGKRWLGTVLVAGLAALTAACGNTGNAANDAAGNAENVQTTAPSPESDAAATTPPADKGTLTVYLNDFDSIIAPLFEEATGYKMEVVVGNGAEIMSRVEAEKGNPHWDVLWLDAMPSIHGLGASGQLLEDWTPSNAANLTDFAKGFLPEKQWYVPTGAHAAGVIVYNKNLVKATDAPQSWADFANEKYKDMIGMADPAIAAPAYPFVSWFFKEKAMDGGQAFFSSLMDNGMRVYPKNPNVVKALAAGEISIAALQESNAYAMKNANEPIEIIWPAEGAPASIRVAAIQKDTGNPNAAKAFVEFLLDPKTQQALIDQGDESYFQPSVNGVNAKADRAADAKLVAADASWASENEAAIKQWFADQSVK
ncbi:iron(III) transport system substrate-binding protein [Paenibacillus endophyticus]|uniref:Iron(III) transport system substrate-binding protein n=1 Tax=Paenibacillus endophyticus TaxID=1294268 RepID=A0A7W5G853_9BACL|nr:extracellular solute-binding protein [Paenibacillus endophyticus]MBB3150699.1 iron(III) transport system substrate-binding protein [Paenibacillus endophyticus]